MSRKKPPPRKLPPVHETGAAALAATAGDAFAAQAGEYKGVGCWGIHERATDTFHPRPGMTKSQAYEAAAKANAGVPLTKLARGKNPPAKRKAGPLSAAQWVELLMVARETRATLQAAQDEGRKLSSADVRELMTYHERLPGAPRDGAEWLYLPTTVARRHVESVGRNAKLVADAGREERTLIDSVAKQLNRALGVVVSDAGNAARTEKRKKAKRRSH